MKRLAWPEDQPRLESFLARTNAWMLQPLSNRVEIPAFAAKILGRGVAILALADGGEECGVAAFYCNDRVRRVGFVTLLSVHPQCRGRGLGRDLLERALDEMRTAGMTRVRLEVAAANQAAIKFYLAHAFREAKSDGATINPAAAIFMERALAPEAGQ